MRSQNVILAAAHLAAAMAQNDSPLNNFISAAQGGAAAIASANSARASQSPTSSSSSSSSSITSAPPTSATSSAPATSSAAPATGGLSNGAKIGIIVGVVVGVAFLLGLLIGICCCLRVRKRRRRRRTALPEHHEEISQRPTAPLVAAGTHHHNDHTYRQSQAPSLSQHPAMRHSSADNPFTDGAHVTHDSSPSPHRSHGAGPVTAAVAGAAATEGLHHHHNNSPRGHEYGSQVPVNSAAIGPTTASGAHHHSQAPHTHGHHGPGPVTAAAVGAAGAQAAHRHSHSPHRHGHHGPGPVSSAAVGGTGAHAAHRHSQSPHRHGHHGPAPVSSAAVGATGAHAAHRHSHSPHRHGHHGPDPVSSAAIGATGAHTAHRHSQSPHRHGHHGPDPVSSAAIEATGAHTAHRHSQSPHRHGHHGPGPLSSAAAGATGAQAAHHTNHPHHEQPYSDSQTAPLLGDSSTNTASHGLQSRNPISGGYVHDDSSSYPSSAIPNATNSHGSYPSNAYQGQQLAPHTHTANTIDSIGATGSPAHGVQPDGLVAGHNLKSGSHSHEKVLPLAAGAAAGYGLHHKSHSPERRTMQNPLRQAPTHTPVSESRGPITADTYSNQPSNHNGRGSGPMMAKAAGALAGHGASHHDQYGAEGAVMHTGAPAMSENANITRDSQYPNPLASEHPHTSLGSHPYSNENLTGLQHNADPSNPPRSSNHAIPAAIAGAGAGTILGKSMHHEHGQQMQQSHPETGHTPALSHSANTRGPAHMPNQSGGSTDHISSTSYLPASTPYQQQNHISEQAPREAVHEIEQSRSTQPHKIQRRPVSQKSLDQMHQSSPYGEHPTVTDPLPQQQYQAYVPQQSAAPSTQQSERFSSYGSSNTPAFPADPFSGSTHDGLRMLPSAGYAPSRPAAETAPGGAAFMALQEEEKKRRRRSSASASRSSSNLALEPVASQNDLPVVQSAGKHSRRDRSISSSRSRSRSSRRRSGGLPTKTDKDRPPTPFGLSGIGQPYDDKHLSVLQTEPPSEELKRSLNYHENTSQATLPLEEPAMTAGTHNRGYSTPPQIPSRSPHRLSNTNLEQLRGNSDSTDSSVRNTTSSNSLEAFDAATDPYQPGNPHMQNVPPWERHKWRYSGGTPPASAGINPPPAPWDSDATPQQHRRHSPRTSIDASGRRSSRSPATGINGQPRRLRFEDLQTEEPLERERSPPGAFPSESTVIGHDSWDSGAGVGRAL